MPYSESVCLTAQRILEQLPYIPDPAILNIKFGFDGSGSHPIYRQVNNAQTNNMIMTMFCPLSISTETGDIKWSEQSPNSAATHRALALQLGKESSETLQSLSVFEDDIQEMAMTGRIISVNNMEVRLKVNIVSHMMDLKAANL